VASAVTGTAGPGAFGLYWRMAGVSIRGQMQYKTSFLLSAVGEFFATGIEVAGIWALFSRFGSLEHWNVAQVCLFYGLVHVSFALADTLCAGFDKFGNLFIKTGQFDRVLLRPRSVFLQLIGHEFALRRIGRLTQGLVVLGWAFYSLELTLDAWRLAMILVTIVCAMCFFLSLFMLQATLSFWSVESLEIMNTLTYGGVESAQYPMAIYERWFRNLFTFVVPLACVTYFPVVAILGIDDPLGSSRGFQMAAPLAGIVFFAAAVFIFDRIGVRHYTSTGS